MPCSTPSGFTLVELVIIIVVLGIIAAAGIPRFIDISRQTLVASIDATGASLQNAVILMQANVTAKGTTRPSNNVVGFGDGTVDINTAGFPTDTASTNPALNDTISTAKCQRVWNGILQNPPTTTTSGAVYSSAAPQLYRVQIAGAGPTLLCRYTYRKVASPVRRFDYYVNTGRVIVTNP
ncbi:MAG: prepilin-type N-terminal cleavage/methylation domain-containing protein [Sulfuricaulis sp.]|uniref:prepilin-type N-terminal cleavage/methylation domain-containing protein n=1 Tax=Sulfuricaulis sp. TaxID=2003553 RepID=UPI0025E938F9|nr:prepilin-type N-terminal cleavage/methylation domain-containing protein [Sulfuricaulis sp.]MCR4347660.1 prepilin-type N-terminal cleavage/methylation domain-containing protein [Sulfuricaulis sp.]